MQPKGNRTAEKSIDLLNLSAAENVAVSTTRRGCREHLFCFLFLPVLLKMPLRYERMPQIRQTADQQPHICYVQSGHQDIPCRETPACRCSFTANAAGASWRSRFPWCHTHTGTAPWSMGTCHCPKEFCHYREEKSVEYKNKCVGKDRFKITAPLQWRWTQRSAAGPQRSAGSHRAHTGHIRAAADGPRTRSWPAGEEMSHPRARALPGGGW